MTKKATIPLYIKPLKIFISKTNGLMAFELVCSIGYPSTAKVVRRITFGLTLIFFTARSIEETANT